MSTVVALDIETTGLDPQKDTIIEIGAVRFNGRRVEREWSTLINPGRPIPAYITQLTGITNEMVAHAPPIRSVVAELARFVGDNPIVGHNIGFDLSFLRRYGLFELNDVIDTYEMAAILLPSAGRYNLGALAQTLAVPLPATHRALDDARVTHAVYLRLHELASDLPIGLLEEIVHWGSSLDWKGYLAFREVLQTRSREGIRAREVPHDNEVFWNTQLQEDFLSPLQPAETLNPLDVDEVAAILEHGGAFSRYFVHYEYRPQQVEMLRAIAQALSEGRHLLVEAGTGVGKSLAYLIPAAYWAVQNGTRVVISTNTINLQEQLVNKDIPDVRAALGLDLKAAVLKGRSNYLCPRRLESLRHRGPSNAEELRVLAKVLVWQLRSSSGDRSEINLNGPIEQEIWTRLSAENEECSVERCIQRFGDACPFHRARQDALGAHLLIVNHALLLADVATGNRVLPEYDYLIVDEAHHLEEATTNALSFRISQVEIETLMRELGGPTAGVLGWYLARVREVLKPADFALINRYVQRATDLAFAFENQSRQFFLSIGAFLFENLDRRDLGPYPYQERILPGTRKQPGWNAVEMAWEDAEQSLKALLEMMAQLIQTLSGLMEYLPEDSQDVYSLIGNLYRRLEEIQTHLNGFVFKPDIERIYWAEIQPDGKRISLNTAPVHIGPLMEKHIWHEKSSVILTSATLTAAGEFDYLRGRLSARDADELALGSPFDYESAALLYLVNDIAEPSERAAYQRAVEHGLVQLCRATEGRALVLFTSYAQLRSTAQVVTPLLAKYGILVFEQGEGASPHMLLETFRSTDKAVLLGTRAFWEGVDVPGEALSVLVIAKLPFDVPSDPIVAARAETFDDPFNEYNLPEAILRFRQGFGRLIRSQSDRGVVAIFDKRILTKPYGRVFLESLPPCTVQVGPMAKLPQIAARWLNI